MSSSEHGATSSERGAQPPRVPKLFSVASEPMVQISIYDAARTMLGQAEGYLRLALVPGLYRVHLERGGSVHHELVEHQQDTALTCPGPELQSPAPFHGARTSHDYYVAAAQRYSREDTAPPLDDAPHTSRLFVFLRREACDRLPRRLPSEPVTIHDAEGHQIDAIAPGRAVVDQDLGYIAYSRRVKPGTYRLRAARSRRDAAIAVPPGRTALVFIADTGSLQLAELRLALVPIATGFDPKSRTWSAMESLLAALRVPERTLPLAARLLVPEAIDHDLCFGIAAAHVLWRTGQLTGLAEAVRALMPYREIPDVAILAQLADNAADPTTRRTPAMLAETPPLLRASLTMGLTRPEFDPALLAYSGFAQAAQTGLHDTVWCVWSTRTWDERWIEPAVERLHARDPQADATSIARSLVLATETVDRALAAIQAATPGGAGARASGPPGVPEYSLDTVLGRGPCSTVYRATRVADGREVALKILPVDGGPDRCEKALQDLDRDRPLDHPQLLAATARGTLPEGTGIWLEMELCDGSALDRLSDEDAPLVPADAHRLVTDALAALAHLHAAGIAHGDIKPSNLLVRRDGSVALAGPGLAARRAIPAATRASDAQRFAAPELRDGGAPSKTSDVWAMAATCYFLLTLEFPRDEYAGQSQYDAMANPAISLAQRRPELPGRLVRCIDQALSPADRPPDAAAFRIHLAAWNGDAHTVGAAAPRPSAPLSAAPVSSASVTAAGGGTGRAPGGVYRRAAATLAWVAIIAAGGVVLSAPYTARSPCAQRILADDWSQGVAICLDSRDPRDLIWAARGYVRLGRLDQADDIARQLIAGPRHADGFAIRSDVVLRRGQLAEATALAKVALAGHRLVGDLGGQAEDGAVLSRAAWETGDFPAARDAADQALALAWQSHDPATIFAPSLARADALRQLGDCDAASDTLTDALPLATGPCEQASLQLAQALCSMDTGRNITARRQLDGLASNAPACTSSEISNTIALTQAWLLRWTDPSAAAAKLNEIAGFRRGSNGTWVRIALASAHESESTEALLLRAYLAADRGALAEAEQALDRAAAADGGATDLRWKIAQARGELAELRGGPLGDLLAEIHYRHAAALITASRGVAGPRPASFVASHRPVYEALIALLARNERWRDVFAVVLELDRNDMLRATHDDLGRATVLLPGLAARATGLYRAPRAVDAPAGTAARSRATVDLVLEAWRSRELVIVLAPSGRTIGREHDRVYRLHVVGGVITGQDVAGLPSARRWADQLYEDAGDREAAQALGGVIVPPDHGATLDLPGMPSPPRGKTLAVLATAAFSKVPLPALRDGSGALIIAQRPLVRVLGLQAASKASAGDGPAVVIADPSGKLPGAAKEGAAVATRLTALPGPRPQVFGAAPGLRSATRDRLWEVPDARVLHIATQCGGRPPSLELADGNVDAAELVQQHIAPRLAVLAGTGPAAAMDERGAESPAAGLLRSGTATVIATVRTVTDVASTELMKRFYAQDDWQTDPARAFARVQGELAAQQDAPDEASTSWAAFCVLERPPYVPQG